jgi:hypothetical protein
MVAAAPKPAPALMKALRPSVDGRDGPSESSMIILLRIGSIFGE